MQMFNAEQLQEKWAPLLDYNGLGEIRDISSDKFNFKTW